MNSAKFINFLIPAIFLFFVMSLAELRTDNEKIPITCPTSNSYKLGKLYGFAIHCSFRNERKTISSHYAVPVGLQDSWA